MPSLQSCRAHGLLISVVTLIAPWTQMTISVTTETRRPGTRQLRNDGIDLIFTPYEADAQMAALMRSGRCIACVTEDSDLRTFIHIMSNEWMCTRVPVTFASK